MLRRLDFFKDFTYPEIYEILQAGRWHSYGMDEHILVEGDMDDAYLIIVGGETEVRRQGKTVGSLREGDCFGEAAAMGGKKSTSAIVAKGACTVLKVSATLLEQLTMPCQLRFHKVFMRSMIERLTRSERTTSPKP